MTVGRITFDIDRYLQSKDPRAVPAYGIPEAAHYLRIPASTLRSWVLGRYYPVAGGEEKRQFRPLIKLPDRNLYLLSFFNLVEAHVLSAIRRDHKVPLPQIRKALNYLQRNTGTTHPLLDRRFETDGKHIFTRRVGGLVDISSEGQLVMAEIIDMHLSRITRDSRGLAAKLFPFTRSGHRDDPKSVVIDPTLAFGRPVLAGTRIPTITIAERYKAGDSIEDLARDYGRQTSDIEEAIRCEMHVAA